TLDIIDVSNKSNPTLIVSHNYSGAFTHNVWLTDDSKYALTTDELVGGFVKIWDIQDLNNINLVAEYRTDPNHIPHNVFVEGNFAYISSYVDGVVVLDITDPTSPTVEDQYDTYEGPETGFAGAWGTYPYAGRKYVYVSDIQTGLYILRFGTQWLSTFPTDGVIPLGESVEVAVTFNATGLNGGDYFSDIIITSNDPDEPEIIVTAHLNVTGAPDIWVDPDTMDFEVTYVDYGGTLELVIGNNGTDMLVVTSISSDNNVFTVSQPSATIGFGDELVVEVTFLPTTVGDYSGNITIVSNDPDEGTIEIPLSGSAVEPPVISVSPDSLSADLFTNDTTQQIFTIANTGVTDLVYELSVAAQGRAKTVSTISHPFGKGEYSIPSIDHAASKEIKSRHKDKQRFSLEELRARWTSRNEISTKIKKPRHQRGFNEKSSG
ncbi:MAG: choice-of-anchor B family protein, partial [Candidatus Marinimicrobia bacterium]|nr:choice-of-anchor B family protein [Candidatus Neomarinimicrobiota bacterium]